MEEQKPKEIVLKSIRDSLIDNMDNPFNGLNMTLGTFSGVANVDILGFVNKFIENGGEFCFCPDTEHFKVNIVGLYEAMGWDSIFCKDENIKELISSCALNVTSDIADIMKCKVSLTGCDYLIARTGSIIATSKTLMSRKLQVLPENHIVCAYIPQLVPDLKSAINNLMNMNRVLPSMIVNITGGSRTADIEKTLVRPAHGPCKIYLFLIDKN